METVVLTAPDISCEHCQATIERELGSLPGVAAVAVDIPTHRVEVTHDASLLSRAQIVARLDEEGYPTAT